MAKILKSIPWWGWAAGVVGGALLLKKNSDSSPPSGLLVFEGDVGFVPKSSGKTTAHGSNIPVVHWSELEEDDDHPKAKKETHVLWAAGRERATLEFDIPPGAYRIVVRAMTGDIGYAIKLGGKTYGIAVGPPKTTPVLTFIAKAVNTVAEIAPKIGADAYSVAVAAAIQAINAIVGAMPDAMARSRAKLWTLFRSGKWGKKNARKAIKKALEVWYDDSLAVAAKYGDRRGYWRFEGDSAGTWPLVGTEPLPGPGKPVDPGDPITDNPDVEVEEIGGGYLRVFVTTGETSFPGEIRFDVAVYELE